MAETRPIPVLAEQDVPAGFTRYHMPDGRKVLMSNQWTSEQITRAVGAYLDLPSADKDSLFAPKPIQPPTIGETTQQAYGKVAKPVTSAVAMPIGAAIKGVLRAVDSPHYAKETPAADYGRTVAQAVIPQTPVEAGIMAGTMGAGGLVAKAGLTGLKAAATRMAGGTVGGAIGGGLSEEGAALGATKGAVGGALGEGIGWSQEALRRGITNLTGGLYARDATKIAPAIGDLVPAFKGMAKDADTLRDMVQTGKGHNAIFDALAGAYDDIANKTKGQLFSKQTTAGAMSKLTGVTTVTGRAFPEVQKDLRDLYKKGWPADATAQPSPAAMEAKDQFFKMLAQTQQELATVSPALANQFREARRDFRVGINILDMLHRANGPSNRLFQSGGSKINFNTSRLQNYMAANERELRREIGDAELEGIAREVFRGAPIGRGDTEGISLGRILFRNTGPVSGGAFIESFPKISAPYYTGQPVPFRLGAGRQTLLDMAIGQGVGHLTTPPVQEAPSSVR